MAYMAGGKTLRKFLQTMMILYSVGSCIGYHIFMAKLLGYALTQLFPESSEYFTTMQFRAFVNLPISCVILLPLSLKRDMSSLAFAGIMSVVALFYTMMVLIVEAPLYAEDYRNDPRVEVKAAVFDVNILTSCSLVFFAYTCQANLLPIYSELVRPDYRRIKKVINRSLTVDYLFYLIIATAGYCSLFNATNDIVIQRPALTNYDPDFTALLAAIAICIVLFATFPMNFNPARNQLFLLFFKEPNYSQKR